MVLHQLWVSPKSEVVLIAFLMLRIVEMLMAYSLRVNAIMPPNRRALVDHPNPALSVLTQNGNLVLLATPIKRVKELCMTVWHTRQRD